MKNITNEVIKQDYNTIVEMCQKYTDAIYENQEAQVAHYDKQPKLVKLCMEDVRVGLNLVSMALCTLRTIEVIED